MFKRQLTSALLVALLGGFAASAGAADVVVDSTDYQRYQRYLDSGLVQSTATDTTTRASGFEAYQRYLGFTNEARSSAGDEAISGHAAASTYGDYLRVIGGFSLENGSPVVASRIAAGYR